MNTLLISTIAVAILQAVPKMYHYLVPVELGFKIKIGLPILVPLRSKIVTAYVMELNPSPNNKKLRPIEKILNQEPLFGPSWTELIKFCSRYYNYPPGLCLAETLPVGLQAKLKPNKLLITEKGLKELSEKQTIFDLPTNFVSQLKTAQKEGLIISSKLNKNTAKKALQKLEQEGYLNFVQSSVKVSMGHKLTYWVSKNNNKAKVETKNIGSQGKKMLANLPQDPVEIDYFKQYMKDPLGVAKRLAQRNLISLEQKPSSRTNLERSLDISKSSANLILTEKQELALNEIVTALDKNINKNFLLFGITGSGKSEVYLRAAKKTLALNKQVLWLVPEIALSAGVEGFLRTNLPFDSLAVLHSGLSPGERHDQWLKIKEKSSLVVLGARSAVFAPVENLGLVVVDEEHDIAYKQDNSLRYNGRDLALWRAKNANAVTILGSATPSLESYQAALSGRYQLLKLNQRIGLAGLPKIKLLNNKINGRIGPPISNELKKRLKNTLESGEQALLFVNRRGLANLPMCLSCRETLKCKYCSVNLTLHEPTNATVKDDLSQHKLICHRCGYQNRPPKKCPFCNSALVRYMGLGTEKLLDLALKVYPKAKAARLDADSTRKKGSLKKILEAFNRQELNLLVGTQIAAKGHDFPKLTLVGVVEADLSLNMPDFRAAERTFQLLTQVAGRAGRAESSGLVLIQTTNPNHYTLLAAKNHDYEDFFNKEIQIRKELKYPPFSRLALLRFFGTDENLTEDEIYRAKKEATKIKDFYFPADDIEILGPMPSPIAKIKNNFRFQILIKTNKISIRHKFINHWIYKIKKQLPKKVKLTVDIDPYNLI